MIVYRASDNQTFTLLGVNSKGYEVFDADGVISTIAGPGLVLHGGEAFSKAALVQDDRDLTLGLKAGVAMAVQEYTKIQEGK